MECAEPWLRKAVVVIVVVANAALTVVLVFCFLRHFVTRMRSKVVRRVLRLNAIDTHGRPAEIESSPRLQIVTRFRLRNGSLLRSALEW